MRAESTKCRPSGLVVRCALRAPGVVVLGLLNRDATAVFADSLVLHLARDHRKQRVVAAESDAGPGADLRASLADQDRARVDQLATIDVPAQALRMRVAPVARRPAALLVCHLLGLLLGRAPCRLLGRRHYLLLNTPFLCHTLRLGRNLLARRGLCAAFRLDRPGGVFLLFCREADAADGDDLERGQVCAAAVMHAHALFRLVANTLDARSAPMRDDLGVHVEAVDRRTAHLDLVAVVEQQDSSELD